MVLSLGPGLTANSPKVEPGAVLTISTLTSPDLRGARTAISGGPLLAYQGERRTPPKPNLANAASYELRSMWDRHPRTALGWNSKYVYLVLVDGRQKDLSMGMMLDELGDYMVKKIGCTDVMNLDGGGSAMMWANGRIANSPCDGGERAIANALVVVRKEKADDPSRLRASNHGQSNPSNP
jgi:exopolysaccharide biosynthesis protein